MRNRILSLCLSAVILMGAGAFCGTAAQATETAGEGASAGDLRRRILRSGFVFEKV